MSETRALSFETDAAPADLSPWGLQRPSLILTFLASNKETLTIHFGIGPQGNLFAKRKGSKTIMRIPREFLEKIAINSQSWRHSRLWSLSRVDLTSLERREGEEPPIELSYSFLDETWEALQNEKDLTSQLDPTKAEFLLTSLENLQVSTWLSPADPLAKNALESPDLSFTITENTIDEFGEEDGQNIRILDIATDTESRNIYGRLSTEEAPFILAPEDLLKLLIPLLDE